MVFITIMTRGAARFFRFFRKNQNGCVHAPKRQLFPILLTPAKWTGGPVVKDSLTTRDIKKPRAAILADPLGRH